MKKSSDGSPLHAMQASLTSSMPAELSRIMLGIARRLRDPFRLKDPNRFLRRIHGVIHVGASGGQERDLYAKFGQRVLWIEPIPHVFDVLSQNIKSFPLQRAVNRLITDRDDAEYVFHVANNYGMSSSILPLDRHQEMWPEVKFESQMSLRSITLDTLLAEMAVKPRDYEALVIDTQGSELLVLNGARQLLGGIKYVKTEAADFEAYSGCAKVADLESFLSNFNFALVRRDKFAEKEGVGCYYDLLFRRRFLKSSKQ
jgi:FkbM family methyltransferase